MKKSGRMEGRGVLNRKERSSSREEEVTSSWPRVAIV